jgi:ferric-dicitrate binding protein FerR (iron transport regulator)
VAVAAGEVARSEPGRVPTRTRPADIRALLDWPGGLLLFQGTPLERAAEEVERAFGRDVTVESDALRALRISGSFQDESFEEVVQGLCDASGATCRIDAGGAVIAPGGAAPTRS